MIDLSWASSRLEGNTYSRLDTERLIEFGQAASDKDMQETQMILNHKAAIEFLVQNADRVGFNRETLLALPANSKKLIVWFLYHHLNRIKILSSRLKKLWEN